MNGIRLHMRALRPSKSLRACHLLTFGLLLSCGGASTDDAADAAAAAPVDASSQVDGTSPDAATPTAADLPLLPAGFHLGEMTTFAAPTAANRDAIASARSELIAAGMRVGRTQVAWNELEPSPGVFDQSVLLDRVRSLKEDGLAIFLTLETIDSEGFVLAPDLQTGPLALADGMSFDDPRITSRFAALLDWVVPIMVANGGYAISVGNEPDNTIADQPGLAAPVAGFLAAARQHAHQIDDRLAITMTLTGGALAPGATYAAPIVAASDALSINYYCQQTLSASGLRTPAEVTADLDKIVALADGRSILVQELGCSATVPGSTSSLAGSDADQAAFIQHVTAAMRARSAFRVAYWFTLIDWPRELADAMAQPLCDEGLTALCEAFRDAMVSYGLLHWDDGSRRPGFAAYRDAMMWKHSPSQR